MRLETRAYIRALRSTAKRDYAVKYLTWMESDQTTGEPDRGALSYMAAQAVRLNLVELEGSGSELRVRARGLVFDVVGPMDSCGHDHVTAAEAESCKLATEALQ